MKKETLQTVAIVLLLISFMFFGCTPHAGSNTMPLAVSVIIAIAAIVAIVWVIVWMIHHMFEFDYDPVEKAKEDEYFKSLHGQASLPETPVRDMCEYTEQIYFK